MRANTDARVGPSESGHVTITAADGTTPQTALDIDATGLFRLEAVKIEYDSAATADCVVELYDDADGTTAGNVSDQRDTFRGITPGSTTMVDNLDGRDFEEDVLVKTEAGSQDDEVDVTVYGTILRSHADLQGR